MAGFVHLHCRSYFSLKDGAYSPEDLVARAAELGMPAVAMTDRDGLYGAPRFAAACRAAGVKPIYGAWITLWNGEASPHRVLLIARDNVGYANLCRLLTVAHMGGERGEPSVTPAEVMAHAEGLVCLLGPESPVGRLALGGRPGAARERIRPWREAFGPWCFVEVRDLREPGSVAEVRALVRLAEEAGAPAVATNAVRYLVPGDAFLADALECMREIVPIDSHHVSRRNAEGWLKPPAAMRSLFADRPDLCDASVRIAEACQVDLGLGTVHFPDFPTPAGRSATSVLAERAHAGMARRYGRPTRDVLDRLDHELAMIQKMGYAAYFLTVADIVEEVKAMGIRCACRGSAAGSLVCYLTGISEVDAVRHDLLFERFLNPQREGLPDVDLDVEAARREEVYDLVLGKYGEDRCACVTMVDTYRARAAIREVGKALGYPGDEIDRAAKAFPHVGAHRIREALERLPELRGSNLGAGQLELLFRVAERLNGFPRHLALHPSGIVLSGHDLPDRVPMERSFQGHRMVQADKDDVELLGLLKLDVLGVRMLSSIRHCLDEVERTTGERLDLEAIRDDDSATWELIRDSRTIGCFQIESPGQRELLQKFQPVWFEDLIIDISLFRPGPVKSDMVTPFIRRRHDLESSTYAHESLRPALRETHGVIVYHEQVMRVIDALLGCGLVEADRIRRHLDEEQASDEVREEVVSRAVARGFEREHAERIWDATLKFASFGFCKAHAAAFAVPTYQSAWLKAHHTAAFLAGVLTHEPGMYPRRLILEDAREHGIPILPLDVNISQKAYTVEVADVVAGGAARVPTDGSVGEAGESRGGRRRGARTVDMDPSPGETAVCDSPAALLNGDRAARAASPAPTLGIRLGLQDVHGISEAEIGEILEKRPFTSVGDFLRRATVSRPVVEALAHAGAFDGIGDDGPAWTRRDRLYVAMTAEVAWEGEQLTLGLHGEAGAAGLREYTDAERVRAELEVHGMDASRHLLSFFEPLLADLGVVRSVDLRRRRGDEWVMVAGVKVASQTPAVRSGQRIIFLTLDDATGPVDVTVFERVQDRVARTVFHSFVLAIWGRLRRTGVGGVSIIAEEVWDLVALNGARRESRLREVMTASAGGEPDGRVEPRKLWHASGGSAGW